ncbi:hypothetical protein WJX73_007867 [Symbiochloris irregularis]|uniref:RING-type E3 ubiquitin transferase n=1 Tax=Symbiochloris irregularis TaxID=706552 RepID=A0AAW1PDE6_9CHLO
MSLSLNDSATYEELEDSVLSRALMITLRKGDLTPPGKVYLPHVAQEIAEEQGQASSDAVLLSAETVERTLMAFLLNPSDPTSRPGLCLTLNMFPQPPEAERLGKLQLYESLKSRAEPLPAGFLDDLGARFEDEGLQDLIEPTGMAAAKALMDKSLLDNFQTPLNLLLQLFSVKSIAAALAKAEFWMPDRRMWSLRGRAAQGTILGYPFGVSGLPDTVQARPTAELQQALSSRQGDAALRSSISSLQVTSVALQRSLHQLVMLLLKPAGTRPAMLAWFAAVLEINDERAKLQGDPALAASDGFFLNLSAVLLRCCQPFLEPLSGKAWGKVDPRYVVSNPRISFAEETRLNADADEQAALAERMQSGAEAGAAPQYHFICECFFITAKGLHLGLLRIISACYEAVQKFHHLEGHMREMDAVMRETSSMPPQLAARAELLKTLLSKAQAEVLMYQTALSEEELLQSALAFYRLMAAWLLRLASPAVAAGEPVQLPLPTPAPAEFRMLPEYFVEDTAELLLYLGRYKPRELEGARLEEIALFLLVFLASPQHVRNPYLRSKLAEVLLVWLPHEDEQDNGRFGFRNRRSAASSTVASLFEGHPMVQQHMVRSLIQLYVDMEHTGRNTAFYEKFSTRHSIGQILSYLWNIPAHQEAWKALAREQGGRGLYMRFCHHLETDSIHLLDEAMKLLPEIKELERALADEAAWAAQPEEQAREREATLQQHTRSIRADLDLAAMAVNVMRFSTQDITATWLLPEAVPRIASMLNYFLMHLTGPGRRKLKLKDPEHYHWRPKELLASICDIYVHLGRADGQGVFAAAIAEDGRCYRPEMFPEAAQVLSSFALLDDQKIGELDMLAARVASAGASAKASEAANEEAPEEFWDPIMATIMDDPVILPTSSTTVDRATIMRHLLSDPNDPFNRQPLTEQDLVPNVELKQRIDQWRGASNRDEPAETSGRTFLEFPSRSQDPGDKGKDPELVRVRLTVPYRVHSRQMLCIGGSQIPFGWSFLSIAKVPMIWTEGDIWQAEFELPARSKIEYKYVILEQQDWTKQESEDAEGVVTFTYRTQPDDPPDVQTIQKQMAIVAWQPGPNRVVEVPAEDELTGLQPGETREREPARPPVPTQPSGHQQRRYGQQAYGQPNASPMQPSRQQIDELAGTWETLQLDEDGMPLLERRDVWGFVDNTARNRGLRFDP